MSARWSQRGMFMGNLCRHACRVEQHGNPHAHTKESAHLRRCTGYVLRWKCSDSTIESHRKQPHRSSSTSKILPIQCLGICTSTPTACTCTRVILCTCWAPNLQREGFTPIATPLADAVSGHCGAGGGCTLYTATSDRGWGCMLRSAQML
uniref:Cysteine protease n=1 Tax=Lygus hesperus TaxID=30085 RepID=A0A0A9XTE4_LYGHE